MDTIIGNRVEVWHIPIMGFRQSLSAPTGIERLWWKLRALKGEHTTILTPLEWDQSMPDIAEFVWRWSVPEPTIHVYAYSWGCGVGFINLSKALAKRGIKVSRACLCDPVFRSRVLPTWLPANPMSLWSRPTIKIPANVQLVDWVYQRVDKPAGHNLVAVDEMATRINDGLEVQAGHSYIDESHAYHNLALAPLRVAQDMVE